MGGFRFWFKTLHESRCLEFVAWQNVFEHYNFGEPSGAEDGAAPFVLVERFDRDGVCVLPCDLADVFSFGGSEYRAVDFEL